VSHPPSARDNNGVNLTKGAEERALRARSSSMCPSQVTPVFHGQDANGHVTRLA